MTRRLCTAARHRQLAERTIAQFPEFGQPLTLQKTVPRLLIGPLGETHLGRQEITPCRAYAGELQNNLPAVLPGDGFDPGVVIVQAIARGKRSRFASLHIVRSGCYFRYSGQTGVERHEAFVRAARRVHEWFLNDAIHSRH